MKGPGYKLTGDVRRTWRCPQCGRECKFLGDVTTQMCRCQDGTWMKIVVERIARPRPVQRPSDIERRPIDFGIEPPPAAPPKPAATIVKSAIDPESDPIPEAQEPEPPTAVREADDAVADDDEDWGEGIL